MLANHRVSIAPPPSGIVGIGASAGGLVALENFLSHVQPNTGLAYVIVQHQPAGRESLLLPLLQRHTTLPVQQAQSGLLLQPNHVYLNVPEQQLAVLGGVLQLLQLRPLPAPPSLPLPIDFLFISLAADQRQRSMGVVLSGLGVDGTAGLRAIHQAGGACFVQSPDDAQFDAMPRSAMNAGLADTVDAAARLPGRILAHAQGRQRTGSPAIVPEREFLDKVIALLRSQTGHDFSLYKQDFVMQRLTERMGQQQLTSLPSYLRCLREDPKEVALLAGKLLIGVTRFFRDAPALEQLKSQLIPTLLASHPDGAVLRAWVPGCASAEEAYSLAIVFLETLDAAQPSVPFSLQIFATDLDANNLSIGRAGVYPQRIAEEMSPQRLLRFFVKEGTGYRVQAQLREMVTFAQHNLLTDPPLAHMDLISCCNVLIYLQPELLPQLMATLHYSLNNTSFLMLGQSESVGSATDLFAQVATGSRLYRRLNAPRRKTSALFPTTWLAAAGISRRAAAQPDAAPERTNLKMRVEQLLAERFAPAAALTNTQGDVLYLHGDTRNYLELGSGEPCMNLFAMLRGSLKQALRDAFDRTQRLGAVTTLPCLPVTEIPGHWVTIRLEPLQLPQRTQDSDGLMLVLFTALSRPVGADASHPPGQIDSRDDHLLLLGQQLQMSQAELKQVRQELHNAHEALQTSQEESQTALQAQTLVAQDFRSLNTELAAFNSELQFKLADLGYGHQQLSQLIASSGIAWLSLDRQFHVRNFNAAIGTVIKLMAGDQGRPITDISSALDYPTLLADAREVLCTQLQHECERRTHDGRLFRVCITPSSSAALQADGVLITLLNISSGNSSHQGGGDGLP